jgi:hypothetical protein
VSTPIGMKIHYKKGIRSVGYSLFKDGVVYQVEGQSIFNKIKQWSKVPFAIEEEKMFFN